MGDNDQDIEKDVVEGYKSPQIEGDTRPLSYDASGTLKTWDVHVTIDTRDDEDAGRVAVALAGAGHPGLEAKDGKYDLVVQANAVNEGAAERAVLNGPLLAPIFAQAAGHKVESVTLRGETYGDHRHDLNPALESGVGPDGTVDAAQPIGSPAVDTENQPEGQVKVTTPGERISEAARAPQAEARKEEAEKRVADKDDLKKTEEDKKAMKKAEKKAEKEAEKDSK